MKTVKLSPLPFLASLLFLCNLPLPIYSAVLNITTLSRYTYVYPGIPVPGPGADVSASIGASAPAFDSSAAASDHSDRSEGVPGSQGSRHPAQILGKPSGEGHWATPAPHSGIALPFVPYKMLAQVRHTYETNHRPRSDAIASASTAEEAAAAARLKESIQTKKISEVYSEEGYEDSAYDHAGFKKDAGFSEGHAAHEGAKGKKGHIDIDKKDSGIDEAETVSEDQKYPFNSAAASSDLPIHSPLRYALNPASGTIPKKSKGGMEFYESTDNVECPVVVDLPPIPGRKFVGTPTDDDEEGAASEESEGSEDTPKPAPIPPPPPSPRLKGLGDKIDCIKRKYFGGDEPLDNPLFKEKVINKAQTELQKVKAEAEGSKKEEVKSEESKESPQKKEERLEGIDSDAVEDRSPITFPETVGEDRIGVEGEESSGNRVGAALSGLPSGSASDSDMDVFYADIMGHIRSATGNIIRQAYRGNDGSNSEDRVRKVKPPKPPIIGFFPSQEVGLPITQYPSVLPAPSNPSYRNYAVHDDNNEDEEEEEQAGSETDEEEEDDHHHHHHGHPNVVGGSRKPVATFLLRPVQVQKPTAFRPSPLLYVHTPQSQRESSPPNRVNYQASPSSGEPSHQHRPHHHHYHNSYSHTYTTGPPFHAGGVRTFLIPAGARPVAVPAFRYAPGPIGGIRGSGSILVSSAARQHPNAAYPSGQTYKGRDYPLKRQLPEGQEFDGLLTATTQMTSVASPPMGFAKPPAPQAPLDLMSSPSITTHHSVDAPKNIEYFTLKDTLPPRKTFEEQHSAQPSQMEVSHITFTTTESPSPSSYSGDSAAQAIPVVGGYFTKELVTQGSSDVPYGVVDTIVSSTSYASETIEQPASGESMVTLDSYLEGTVAEADARATGEGLASVGISPRLVTEQVTKGIVRGAIEEAIRSRAVSPAKGAAEAATKIVETRSKVRPNSRGFQRARGEEILVEANEGADAAGEGDRSQRRLKGTTVDSRWERLRRGEKGDSRTRIGLSSGEEHASNTRAVRGRKRGEPSYSTAEDDEAVSKESGYLAEDRISPVPEESRVTEALAQRPSIPLRIRHPQQVDAPKESQGLLRPIVVAETNAQTSQATSETVELPRKKFVEPRVRGDTRPRIPKKSASRPRSGAVNSVNKQEEEEKTKENVRPETRVRVNTATSEPTVKRWEQSKGRIITSLENMSEGSRRQNRQRENAQASVGRVRSTIRPIVVAELSNQNDSKNQRITRHREVKETHTALYAPEEES